MKAIFAYKVPKKTAVIIAVFFFCVSFLLLAAISVIYCVKSDIFAAVTFYPIWFWFLLGIILSAVSIAWNKKYGCLLTVSWVLFLFVFSEEIHCICRAGLYPFVKTEINAKSQKILRIASLNCDGGNILAVYEIFSYKPDIILLQESPPKNQIEKFMQKMMPAGTLTWGADTTIILNSNLTKREYPVSKAFFYKNINVSAVSTLNVNIFSVRLPPPTIKLNLFSSQCWQSHMEDRRLRRRLLLGINKIIENIPKNDLVIIGGDFNVQAGESCFDALEERMYDSVLKSGIGWPNTVNFMPLWRVDQIWISKGFDVKQVFVPKTKNSDHKMVICDLVVNKE